MAVIKTIEKGESLTFGFVLPETYNLANLQAVKIYIGSSIYEHKMDGRTVRVELESNQTALITGRNIVHFVIDDAVFGIKKINCGELEVLPTQATHKDESVNTGYDVEIVLSINVETVSVGSVLYDTLKGDKGDAGTIEVGTVTTGDAGTDVIVENVGTPSEAVLNFTIPRGDAGYTPYIGENGNWFINGVDTGVQAEGDATQQWVTDNFVVKESGKSLISDTLISKVTELSPLFWDEDNNTFSFPVPDGGVIQIGQEPHDYYTNLQGSQIVNGDIVSTFGATGNRTAIKLTDATNDALALSVLGMVTVESIGNNNVGRITKSGGKVRGLNTDAYNEGDILYVDPSNSGKWTNIKPAAPLRAIQIGVVTVKHAVNGVVELMLKVYPKFTELADVDGATTEVLDGETIPVKKTDGLIKFLSWSNIKATLKTYFDALYEGLSNKKTTLTDSDIDYPTTKAVKTVTDNLKEDVMVNSKSIATLENVLSDANINQEAQVTASGVDTIALPKTAANTGMQVKLFGQSAQNWAIGGDMESVSLPLLKGVDSGGAVSSLTQNTVNPIRGLKDALFQVTTAGTNTSRPILTIKPTVFNYNSGDIVYFSFRYKVNSGSPRTTLIHNGTTSISLINTFSGAGLFSYRFSGGKANEAVLGSLYFDSTSLWSMQIDDLMWFNLTATFGAGNEPNKEQCDLLFANYFEGSDNVIGTGRIRSVNSSGLLPSYLYFNGGQLRSNGLIKDEIRKGTNGYELVQRINPADGTVRTTPVITPIAHAGLLNSNSNGTAYFEPIIADAGVYSSNLAIQLTDYPIASFESIRKYANGTYTELNPATAVIASGGLSFTHPDLVGGDLVMFTYAYSIESVGRSMTLTHYDSRFVIADTANSKVYRWRITSTNGVATIQLTEV